MVDSLFLAMTAQELARPRPLPAKTAWLSCRFDPQGTGLTGLPTHLPKGSMVLLDDSILPKGHDIHQVFQQLSRLTDTLHPSAILLDFQRPADPALAQIARHLQSLPCPVAVPPTYAADLQCPVFLPPVPPHCLPGDHIAPWKGRKLYLELALDASILTVTENGCQTEILPYPQDLPYPHQDALLHCRYRIDADHDRLRFTLARTSDDLPPLLEDLHALGVTALIGLHQELSIFLS